MKHKNQNTDWIVGRNPIFECIKSGREINAVLIAPGHDGRLARLIAAAKERKIPVKEVPKTKLDQYADGRPHQGVAAQIAAYAYADLWKLVDDVEARGEDPFFIILDGIEDPHNLGAILRTADAAGAHGVIIEKRQAVGLTQTVAKASAGAIEYVPVARVSNIADTIERFKKRGIWVYGADAGGAPIENISILTEPVALVIGAEGEGLGNRVRKCCDGIISLPMVGKVNSLNASVAAALVMYQVLEQRQKN